MRVLGAIDMAEGKTIRDRIKAVSQMTFTDEEGRPRQFTWSTISTWLCRYQKHGVTVMENQPRSDKGKLRKVAPEDILEAIRKVRPKLHGKMPTRALLYRLCIEQGLLTRSQVAPNTFSRLVNQFEMLKPDTDCANKQRLAFAKAHANEMWQADTLYGPHVHLNGLPVQTRLIAFIDDASRVCCHGQFFLAENVDTLIESFRSTFYKRGVPHALYVDNSSIYSSRKSFRSVPASAASRITRSQGRSGQGQSRKIFQNRAGSVPRPRSGLELPRQSQPAVHPMGPGTNTMPRFHSILGMSPLDRYALDRKWVRFLPPNEANDELFFVEEERHVRADNTFSAGNRSAGKRPPPARPHHPHPLPTLPPRGARGGLLQGRTHGRSAFAQRHRQRPKTFGHANDQPPTRH